MRERWAGGGGEGRGGQWGGGGAGERRAIYSVRLQTLRQRSRANRSPYHVVVDGNPVTGRVYGTEPRSHRNPERTPLSRCSHGHSIIDPKSGASSFTARRRISVGRARRDNSQVPRGIPTRAETSELAGTKVVARFVSPHFSGFRLHVVPGWLPSFQLFCSSLDDGSNRPALVGLIGLPFSVVCCVIFGSKQRTAACPKQTFQRMFMAPPSFLFFFFLCDTQLITLLAADREL